MEAKVYGEDNMYSTNQGLTTEGCVEVIQDSEA